MRAIRKSLHDNLAATTFVALLSALLMLNGMLSAFARSGMSEDMYADQFGIICISTGTTTIDATTEDGNSPIKLADCPCAIVCQLLSVASLAFITPEIPAYAHVQQQRLKVSYTYSTDIPIIYRISVFGARAPPLSI